MSQLSSNSLWGGLTAGASDVADRVTGPSFDYTANIQTPEQQGVGESGDLGQLVTNAGAVGNYVSQLVTGPLLGNTQFVETGGMCKAPGGGVVPRWSYIDNRLGGGDALPESLRNAIGGDLEGLIPGMFGDIAAMSPLPLMNSLWMDGVPPCDAYSCPVTDAQGNSQGNVTKFLTPELEENVTQCSIDAANRASLEASEVAAASSTKEGFAIAPPRTSPYRGGQGSGDSTGYVMWGVASCLILAVLLRNCISK